MMQERTGNNWKLGYLLQVPVVEKTTAPRCGVALKATDMIVGQHFVRSTGTPVPAWGCSGLSPTGLFDLRSDLQAS